jgi:hypothetical protein
LQIQRKVGLLHLSHWLLNKTINLLLLNTERINAIEHPLDILMKKR